MSLEKIGTNQVKLTLEVPAEQFVSAIAKAYTKNSKRYNIPGFRKGKAPLKVIENYYGEGVFYEDAFEEIYNETYHAALDAEKIIAVDNPQLDVIQIGRDKPLIYTAVVTTYPEVKLGDYKGIEVERVEYNVMDSEIDAELNKARDRVARFVDVDRPAENGDTVVIDYSGSIDGVKFEGGTAQKQKLVLGSGSFIPGFEDGVIGMNKEETKDIEVKFPDEYHAENLKGKNAVFTVVLHEIKKKELPELDDEFAKDVSDFDTLDQYKADIRKQLEEGAAKRAQTEMENKAIEKVVANATVDIPEVMIERQLSNNIQDMEYKLKYQGIGLEDYLKITNTTMEDLHKQFRPEAEKAVRVQLVMEEVCKTEAIEATEEQINAELEKYKGEGKTVEEMRKSLNAEYLEYMKRTIVMENTIKAIMDAAVIVDKKPEKDTKKTTKKSKDKSEEKE